MVAGIPEDSEILNGFPKELTVLCGKILQHKETAFDPRSMDLNPASLESAAKAFTAAKSIDDEQAFLDCLVASMVAAGYPLLVSRPAMSGLNELTTERLTFIRKAVVKGRTRYTENYDNLSKDLKFLLGHSLPCSRSHFVEYGALVPRKCLLTPKALASFGSPVTWVMAGLNSRGHWLGLHLDNRDIRDFHEAAMDRCYLKIAELMQADESLFGLVGGSWIYDPQLTKISPKLAYLREKRVRNGAFVFDYGTSENQTRMAIANSPVREKLYNDGQYTPHFYFLIWPRAKFLRFARKLAHDMQAQAPD